MPFLLEQCDHWLWCRWAQFYGSDSVGWQAWSHWGTGGGEPLTLAKSQYAMCSYDQHTAVFFYWSVECQQFVCRWFL